MATVTAYKGVNTDFTCGHGGRATYIVNEPIATYGAGDDITAGVGERILVRVDDGSGVNAAIVIAWRNAPNGPVPSQSKVMQVTYDTADVLRDYGDGEVDVSAVHVVSDVTP